jgi:hypothetical protein
MVDPHRLAEERSLAYHRAVAERIDHTPELLSRAKERVRSRTTAYAREWREILDSNLDVVKRALVDESEAGKARRQSTPFAGALAPKERWRLLREVRERLGS